VPRLFTKLNDHFGQFDILLIRTACNHRRETDPTTLARLCRVASDSLISDVLKVTRCSKYGAKKCAAAATLPKRPRRYSSLPR